MAWTMTIEQLANIDDCGDLCWAWLSKDQSYRYALSRRFSTKPWCVWVMLNPSTVFAWGPGPSNNIHGRLVAQRSMRVRDMVGRVATAPVGHLGGLTANGNPRHPLMPSYETPFVPYPDQKGLQ